MITGSVMVGSGVSGAIVCGPAPDVERDRVERPVLAFASRIAWRSEPAPLSLVLVTVNVAGRSGTVTHARTPTCRWSRLVAVAVTICPACAVNSGNVALPLPLVVTDDAPRNVCAFAVARRSHAALAKNSIVNVVFGVLLSVPCTPPGAADRTGKFCRLFGAGIGVARVVGVTPAVPRSMPRPPLAEIELARIALPVPA